jgi:hypothetical protein
MPYSKTFNFAFVLFSVFLLLTVCVEFSRAATLDVVLSDTEKSAITAPLAADVTGLAADISAVSVNHDILAGEFLTLKNEVTAMADLLAAPVDLAPLESRVSDIEAFNASGFRFQLVEISGECYEDSEASGIILYRYMVEPDGVSTVREGNGNITVTDSDSVFNILSAKIPGVNAFGTPVATIGNLVFTVDYEVDTWKPFTLRYLALKQ